MKGMFLSFRDNATITAAIDEYVSLYEPEDDWVDYRDERIRLAELIEYGKGIPLEATYEFLHEVYGAPQFRSPAQRRWYFATHPKDRGTARPEEPKGVRWEDIVEQARSIMEAQPEITGPELVGLISVDPPLTPSEEQRVQRLVSPERGRRFVRPPEAVPREERTPEVEELVEQRFPEKEKVKEKRREKEVEKGPKPVEKEKKKSKPSPGSGKGMIPPFVQQGIPYVGAARKSRSQKEYFLEECPEIADGDHWRAFQQAIQLVRSDVEFNEIRDEIMNEYPEVDPDEIVKAAKGFLREGGIDPYVDGRMYVETLIRQGEDGAALAAMYHDMGWQEVHPRFLQGFREGVPENVLRLINRKRTATLF